MHELKIASAAAWILLVVTFASSGASATPAGPGLAAMYDREELARAASVYTPNLRGVFEEDLIARLPSEERAKVSGTKLELPLVGANAFPFDYYAQPGRREVTIPIFSVKFMDDVSIAAAWLERRGCTIEPLWEYAAMLTRKEASAFPGGRPPNPRAAVGVPANALEDSFVDDVSQKSLKSAIYFMMAHELGHVRYQHLPYDRITAAQARSQEAEADRYALRAMRGISVAPLGMVILFGTHARFEPGRGEFASEEEYRAHRSRYGTHPLSPDRIARIGAFISDNANAFAAGQEDPASWVPRIRSVATDVNLIGTFLGDEAIRTEFASRARRKSPAELRSACR